MPVIKRYLKENHQKQYNEIYESEIQHVQIPSDETANETIQRALKNAEVLIRESDPSDAVDRMHTVLHAYLKEICDNNGMKYKKTDSLPKIWAEIRKTDKISMSELTSNIMMGLATAIQHVNEARNSQSLTHPNENLLGEEEVWLVINAIRTMYIYI